jgi:hypothetical protein
MNQRLKAVARSVTVVTASAASRMRKTRRKSGELEGGFQRLVRRASILDPVVAPSEASGNHTLTARRTTNLSKFIHRLGSMAERHTVFGEETRKIKTFSQNVAVLRAAVVVMFPPFRRTMIRRLKALIAVDKMPSLASFPALATIACLVFRHRNRTSSFVLCDDVVFTGFAYDDGDDDSADAGGF